MKNKSKTKAELLKELEILQEERKKGVFKDIAESIQAEKKLRDSEERLKILFDYAPDAYYISDLKGNFIDGNKAAESLMGYKKEELIGKSFLKLNLLTLTDIPKAAKLLVKNLRGLPTGPDEFVINRKDNSKVTVEISTYPVKIKGRTLVLGIARDITERKKAEEELRKSETLLTETGRMAKVGGWEVDTKTLEVSWTEETYRIHEVPLGHKPPLEEAINFFHPHDRPKLETAIQKALEDGEPYDMEIRLITAKGKHLWTRTIAKPIIVDGKTVKLTGTFQDITERKQAEETLQRYKHIVSSSTDMLALLDEQFNYLAANTAYVEAFKLTLKQLIGNTPAKVFGKEYFNTVIKPNADRCLAGEEVNHQNWIDFPAYGRRYMDVTYYPYYSKDKKVIGFVVNGRDITQRKQAEEELQLRAAMMDNVAEGVYLIGLDDLLIKWTNERFTRMFGYDPGEMVGKHVDIISAPTTERTPTETRIAITDILKETREWHGEIRNIKRDGTHFWCYANISLFDHPEYGKIIVAVSADITERKLAEERLKKSMNATIETVSRIIEARDPYTSGHQHWVCQLAVPLAQELGLSQDKVEGIRVTSLIHDIGKISLPTEILSKPTKLTDIEFSLIKDHSQIGYDILKSIDFAYPIAKIVLQHHERLDGSGYPNKLKGDEIILEARIIGIADVVEAMSSHRPYRPALGIDRALEEISQNKGILYDPEVVDACIELFKEKRFKFKSE